MRKLRISREDIIDELGIAPPSLPRYVAPLLNLANRFSGATRPQVVGQMSDLIREFDGDCLEDWEEWYRSRYPTAIDDATQRVRNMVGQFRAALAQLDDDTISEWLRDLIIVKTYQGLKVQGVVLRQVAAALNRPLRPATSQDESQGIDGYIGDTAVSVKPSTLDIKPELLDNLPKCIIFYEKTSAGLTVSFDETLIA